MIGDYDFEGLTIMHKKYVFILKENKKLYLYFNMLS